MDEGNLFKTWNPGVNLTERLKPRPPPHLLGGLVPQLGGDTSERFPIGSSLLTGGQDGAVRLPETGRGQSGSAASHAS